MAGIECCRNPPVLDPNSGNGEVMADLGGLKAYVSGSTSSRCAIILATDIYGYEAPHIRLIADEVASAGYFAVVPDLLYGDPYDDKMELNVWLEGHPTEQGTVDARKVIAGLRAQMGFTTVGAAGFCWGGKIVTNLAKTTEIQVAVLLHPAFETVDDMKKVVCPMALLGGELDNLSPPQLLQDCERVLTSRKIDSYLKIFGGVEHGWTLRYDDSDVVAVRKSEEARAGMLAWFNKHLATFCGCGFDFSYNNNIVLRRLLLLLALAAMLLIIVVFIVPKPRHHIN